MVSLVLVSTLRTGCSACVPNCMLEVGNRQWVRGGKLLYVSRLGTKASGDLLVPHRTSLASCSQDAPGRLRSLGRCEQTWANFKSTDNHPLRLCKNNVLLPFHAELNCSARKQHEAATAEFGGIGISHRSSPARNLLGNRKFLMQVTTPWSWQFVCQFESVRCSATETVIRELREATKFCTREQSLD